MMRSIMTFLILLMCLPVVSLAFSLHPPSFSSSSPLDGISRPLLARRTTAAISSATMHDDDGKNNNKRGLLSFAGLRRRKNNSSRGIAAAFAAFLALAPRSAAAAAAAASNKAAPAVLLGKEFNGCVGVMGAWGLLCYIFMLFSATVPGEGASEGHKMWSERIFYNTLEQSPFFLLSFWVHATAVSPANATLLGKLYVFFTMMYALVRLYTKGPAQVPLIQLTSTMPRYSINIYFLATAVSQRCWGIDLVAKYFNGSVWLALGAVAVAFFVSVSSIEALQEKVLMDYFAS